MKITWSVWFREKASSSSLPQTLYSHNLLLKPLLPVSRRDMIHLYSRHLKAHSQRHSSSRESLRTSLFHFQLWIFNQNKQSTTHVIQCLFSMFRKNRTCILHANAGYFFMLLHISWDISYFWRKSVTALLMDIWLMSRQRKGKWFHFSRQSFLSTQ